MQIAIIRTFVCFVRKVPLVNITTLGYHFIMAIRTEMPLLAYFIGIANVYDVIYLHLKESVGIFDNVALIYTFLFSDYTNIVVFLF